MYILLQSKLTQIPFNGTIFINTQLMQHIFSVWPVAKLVVGEMEMHGVVNIADPFSDFFSLKKSSQTLLSPRIASRVARYTGTKIVSRY